ncbi:MAG TPA: HEAT repeat domain-containing protein [Blastocatellia bacterium]|nr:HEAT repeat domain-containing protein [Blastocatellia bacterium]
MCSLRLLAIIAAFLILSVSIPQSLFSQKAPKPSQPKQSAPRQSQTKRSHWAEALAPAIKELLKLDPLDPLSPDEARSDDAGASSEEEPKPPADDAPTKELLAYWHRENGANDPKPSDKVRERLLEVCEARPELIPGLVNFMPENTDTHDRLYKLLEEEPTNDSNWKETLRDWLQNNSRYFRDDLIAEARGDGENGAPSDDSLRSLAELDWEAARPIAETFASSENVHIAPVALSLLYERAHRDGDSVRTEKYRALLKSIVADRQAPSHARQTALSSLAAAEWNGQEDWVVSLFADPTLGGLDWNAGDVDGETKGQSDEKGKKAVITLASEYLGAVLTSVLEVNHEKWIPVVSKLVGHNHRTVHQIAVRCLTEFLDHESADKKMCKEIAQKLAPWLTDLNWGGANDRSGFIQSLVNLQAPELLPGLIWVLENDKDEDNRATAAEALAQYRDPRANPALRRALEKEEDEDRREKIVTALAECGGFSDDEMAAAIEAYAKVVVTKDGEQEIDEAKIGDPEKPLPLKVSIGRILHESETIKATEGMAVSLVERAKALRASQPAVARQILRCIEGVSLRVAEIDLIERIGVGWADIDAVTLALENRDSIRKSAGDELYALIKRGGYAAGVAAAILNDEREQRETLKGIDAKAQLALLAGARYLRDKLPVELAGKLLNSPNRELAKAAERYLEVEDSSEARKLVMARRPGEAYILGDISPIDDQRMSSKTPPDWEETMRKELKSSAGLEAIYAVARPDSDEHFNGVVIRVRGGKAEISLYEVEGRRDVRMLTASEFEELRSFISRQEVEDLGPESYGGYAYRRDYEYLRLTKEGGRRIALDALRRAPKNPTLHEELSGLFYRLSRSGEFVTRYEIEDKIPGVEILLADKKHEAIMVCGEGREIWVLVGEKDAEYKPGFGEAMPEWREFSSGKPGEVTGDPRDCRALSMISLLMKNRWKAHFLENSLPTRSGDAWVFNSFGDDAGVWKYEPGSEPAKIVSGAYFNPVVTPDFKWLVAIKLGNEGEERSAQLVRHNLQTGKEFPVNIENGVFRPPAAYVVAHGKVLLGIRGPHGQALAGARSYLLDPETGTIQAVKGDFRPLMGVYARNLQPTGNSNEFWAAVPDSQKGATNLGRYDSRNFVFTPFVELPGLILLSRDFWVDEASGKIWFTYHGHLLRIPIPPKKMK